MLPSCSVHVAVMHAIHLGLGGSPPSDPRKSRGAADCGRVPKVIAAKKHTIPHEDEGHDDTSRARCGASASAKSRANRRLNHGQFRPDGRFRGRIQHRQPVKAAHPRPIESVARVPPTQRPRTIPETARANASTTGPSRGPCAEATEGRSTTPYTHTKHPLFGRSGRVYPAALAPRWRRSDSPLTGWPPDRRIGMTA